MGDYIPRFDFTASPTLSQFVQSQSFVTAVWGPVGSGKSTACCVRRMANALKQPVRDGWRRSRHAIIRNTTPMLKSTTIKTWLDCFPEQHCGPMRYSAPVSHHIRVPPKDNQPGIDAEFLFIPLDEPKDVDKLRSLDLTTAWVNEGSEIPISIVQMLLRRVGRYPKREDESEAVDPCVDIDSNATDEDNELRQLEMQNPANWMFLHQPPAVLEVTLLGGHAVCIEPDARCTGMTFQHSEVIRAAGKSWAINPLAENLKNLRKRYYQDQLPGSKIEQIQRDLQVKFVYVQDGRPVVPEYVDTVHATDDVPILHERELLMGGDVGGGTLNPAALFGQRHPRGLWLIHDELVCPDVALREYTEMVHGKLSEAHLQWPGRVVGRFWGDPAGEKRDEIFKTVIFDHLKTAGLDAHAAPSQDIEARIQAWRNPLTRLVEGKPALRIHRRCKVLRQALAGKWKYRKLQIAGTDRYMDRPEKSHPYSDIGDAGGYMLLGGGEDRNLRGREQRRSESRTVAAKLEFDIFSSR